MKMMRYKAQDDTKGSHCGWFTVALVHQGTKWARILYIENTELSFERVPVGDATKWMYPLTTYTDDQTLKYFRSRAKKFGSTKMVKSFLYPRQEKKNVQ